MFLEKLATTWRATNARALFRAPIEPVHPVTLADAVELDDATLEKVAGGAPYTRVDWGDR